MIKTDYRYPAGFRKSTDGVPNHDPPAAMGWIGNLRKNEQNVHSRRSDDFAD